MELLVRGPQAADVHPGAGAVGQRPLVNEARRRDVLHRQAERLEERPIVVAFAPAHRSLSQEDHVPTEIPVRIDRPRLNFPIPLKYAYAFEPANKARQAPKYFVTLDA